MSGDAGESPRRGPRGIDDPSPETSPPDRLGGCSWILEDLDTDGWAGSGRLAAATRRRWQDRAANGDERAFQRRRSWLADRDTRAPAPVSVASRELALAEVLDASRKPGPGRPRDAPFAALVAPFGDVALRRLESSVAPTTASAGALGQWRASLEAGLLDVMLPVARLESAITRIVTTRGSRISIRQWAREAVSGEGADAMGPDELEAILIGYPGLARRLADITLLTIDAGAEMFARLDHDRADLNAWLDEPIGTVTAIEAGLGDPHLGRRSVTGLTCSSGIRVLYKPRSLGVDAALNHLLDHLHDRGLPLRLHVPDVRDRGSYGWARRVEAVDCVDHDGVRRFYQRCGMWLGLLRVLQASDMHEENVVAVGESPVLVDVETLLEAPLADSVAGDDVDLAADASMHDGILRSGLLPQWHFRDDGRTALDLSGLTGRPDDSGLHHLPRLNGESIDANDYLADIESGLIAMHELLVEERPRLLERGQPLEQLFAQRVRVIIRPTRVYGAILNRLRAPEVLRSGVDCSLEAELLARGTLRATATGPAIPRRHPPCAAFLLEEEIAAVLRGDVPRFTAQPTSTDLILESGSRLADGLAEPAATRALRCLRGLDHADLATQRRILQAAFFARRASSENAGSAHQRPGESAREQPPDYAFASTERPRRAELIRAIDACVDRLTESAITVPSGGVTWIAPQHQPRSDRYQIQPLSHGLYDGQLGVTLFLAAAAHVTDSQTTAELARRSLGVLLGRIQSAHIDGSTPRSQFARSGLAEGLGGCLLAFAVLARLMPGDGYEQALTALRLPAAHSPTEIDLLYGAAGDVYGAARLLEHTVSDEVYRFAIGRASLLTDPTARRLEALPFGTAHGSAGLALALSSLRRATDEPIENDTLERAHSHLSAGYVEDLGWPDLRYPDHRPAHAHSWCTGAVGILGASGSTTSAAGRLLRARARSLVTGAAARPASLDTLCCGSAGLVDVVIGTRTTSAWPAELNQHLNRLASGAITGSSLLHAGLPPGITLPGLFRGVSGVGWALCRAVAPQDVPGLLTDS